MVSTAGWCVQWYQQLGGVYNGINSWVVCTMVSTARWCVQWYQRLGVIWIPIVSMRSDRTVWPTESRPTWPESTGLGNIRTEDSGFVKTLVKPKTFPYGGPLILRTSLTPPLYNKISNKITVCSLRCKRHSRKTKQNSKTTRPSPIQWY